MILYENTLSTNKTALYETAKNNAAEWLRRAEMTGVEKDELNRLIENRDALTARFALLPEFGTAGIRGIMQSGTTRMNKYTVAVVSRSLAAYLKSSETKGGVVIAYDSRNNSEMFSGIAARVLCEEGIKVFLFDSLRPTPELSFAILYHKCAAGINVTASHNTKEYNGYKVFGENGAQCSPECAAGIADGCRNFDFLGSMPRVTLEDGIKSGMITLIGEETDEAYCRAVLKCSLLPAGADRGIGIVYTPLHGSGYLLVPRILHAAGFTSVLEVESQNKPDGNFPTVEKPNPQYPEAFIEGISVAEKANADIVIATDPDGDRMGVSAKGKDGFRTFTGNQIGLLLLEYIITARLRTGKLPSDACVVKSVVSTGLADVICRANGIECEDVYTGFKYIGEKAALYEQTGEKTFIFGFEESHGYLSAPYARDKDAQAASLLIAEAAVYYKSKGMTLCGALEAIYKKYGYMTEMLVDIPIKSPDFRAAVSEIMNALRNSPPFILGGVKIKTISDYQKRLKTDIASGSVSQIKLKSENMLAFETDRGDRVVVRPSGTEPKIKLYFFINGTNAAECAVYLEALKTDLTELCHERS